MKCSAKAVANHFLESHPRRITHLKLQKLVYLSHGWHLGIFHKLLVEDEFAEAWRYGPVFPSLYHELKKFGSNKIDTLATDKEPINFDIFIPRLLDDESKLWTVDRIWKDYGNLSAKELSGMTHREGSPWDITWKSNPGWRNLSIDNRIIQEYYEKNWKNFRSAMNDNRLPHLPQEDSSDKNVR